MTWVGRNGKQVYYRSHRNGKKVRRDYFGGGDKARLASALDDVKRKGVQEQRATIAALRQRWSAACAPLDQLTMATQLLMRATLLVAGVADRSRKGDCTMDTHGDPVLDELLSLVARVDAGDASGLPQLRTILKDQPQFGAHFGDVARVAADLWISLYARGNLLIAEATREKMVLWKTTIAGPHPSPLETLMIDQITICWLQAYYAESMHAQAVAAKASDAVLREMRRQQDDSQQRLTTGIHQLANLRRLLPQKEYLVFAESTVLRGTFYDDGTAHLPGSPGKRPDLAGATSGLKSSES